MSFPQGEADHRARAERHSDRLRALIRFVLGMSPTYVDQDVPLNTYGVVSRNGMMLLADLEDRAGVVLTPASCPTG